MQTLKDIKKELKSHKQIIQIVDNIKSQIHEQEAIIVTSQNKHHSALQDCQRIEDEMRELNDNHDSKIEDIMRMVSKGKTELPELNAYVKDMQQKVQTLKIEIKNEADSMRTEMTTNKEMYDNALIELEKEREKLSALDEELGELQNAFKAKTNQLNNIQLEITNLNHEVDKVLQEKGMSQQIVQQMERENDWIMHQKHHFGEVNSLYDFENNSPNECKKITRKTQYDFGTIFSELLPNNFAKLQPLANKELKDGLEVKVQLGSVWKEGLNELSGGQRSLIALSLILALLQFKPAPMYILDEVDAALDLSHTQNIGQLLRTRFKGSQFIVISLKEELFNNANVLFIARFRDATSIVETASSKVKSYQGNCNISFIPQEFDSTLYPPYWNQYSSPPSFSTPFSPPPTDDRVDK
ncbi:10756_t:CDS:2 [Entrophospora sp. SA101]|nr:10756_t:CDS:2 [Entrophospora sp. SA101]